ncbi:MAG: serine/threonine protein kinase [Pseudomonadota bacterium]
MSESTHNHPFSVLKPDTIIDAIESTGLISDQRILALNSYENRVYQIGIEDDLPIIAKFYRPERWSDEMILEEHQFTQELNDNEIPVLPPLKINNQSLFHSHGYRFSIYRRFGGYAPELDNPDHLQQLGRILARLHNVGSANAFLARGKISIEEFAVESSQYLLENNFIPIELTQSYTTTIEVVIERIKHRFDQAGEINNIRLHGDCHQGNILFRDEQFYLVDFDDSRTGPVIQDIWMFLSGDREFMKKGLNDFLEGYTEFRDFNAAELHLIEALRTLRLIHYSSWLAKRWEDPAFPIAFPFFNEQRYWEEQILTLREQIALMDEPLLEWQRF